VQVVGRAASVSGGQQLAEAQLQRHGSGCRLLKARSRSWRLETDGRNELVGGWHLLLARPGNKLSCPPICLSLVLSCLLSSRCSDIFHHWPLYFGTGRRRDRINFFFWLLHQPTQSDEVSLRRERRATTCNWTAPHATAIPPAPPRIATRRDRQQISPPRPGGHPRRHRHT
jgi:hypothetical protein